MSKTMEELRKEFNSIFHNKCEEFALKIMECQDEIILAFMAKYGLQPDECVLCYQENKFWVEKKEMTAK